MTAIADETTMMMFKDDLAHSQNRWDGRPPKDRNPITIMENIKSVIGAIADLRVKFRAACAEMEEADSRSDYDRQLDFLQMLGPVRFETVPPGSRQSYAKIPSLRAAIPGLRINGNPLPNPTYTDTEEGAVEQLYTMVITAARRGAVFSITDDNGKIETFKYRQARLNGEVSKFELTSTQDKLSSVDAKIDVNYTEQPSRNDPLKKKVLMHIPGLQIDDRSVPPLRADNKLEGFDLFAMLFEQAAENSSKVVIYNGSYRLFHFDKQKNSWDCLANVPVSGKLERVTFGLVD